MLMLNSYGNDSLIGKIEFDSVKYNTVVISYHGGDPMQKQKRKKEPEGLPNVGLSGKQAA